MDITEDSFKQVKAKKKTWACGSCLGDEDSDASEDQESEDSDDSHEEPKARKKTGKTSPLTKGGSSKKVTMEHILEKINIVIKQNDNLIKRITATERENKELRKELEEMKEEQKQMRRDMQEFKIGKNINDQELLNRNAIVSGLPMEHKDLDQLKKTVQEIGKRLKVDIGDGDLNCVKIGKPGEQKLKVIFKTEEVKDKIMKARRGKNLNTKDLGLENDAEVFINHDLTVANQLLYKKTREVKRNLGYKFAWVSHGRIFLRKTDDSKILHVKSEDYLNNVIVKKN